MTLLLQSGIQKIPEAFAEQVIAEYSYQNGESRKEGKPGGFLYNRFPVHEHVAPAGLRGLNAESEETQARLDKDGAAYAQNCGNGDRGHGVGQNVPGHDAPGRGAGQPRG